jgi:hypothetical protein
MVDTMDPCFGVLAGGYHGKKLKILTFFFFVIFDVFFKIDKKSVKKGRKKVVFFVT